MDAILHNWTGLAYVPCCHGNEALRFLGPGRA